LQEKVFKKPIKNAKLAAGAEEPIGFIKRRG
jgi:hypothetical protein